MIKRWLWSVNRKILIPIFFLKVISILTVLRISTSSLGKFSLFAISFVLKHTTLILISIVLIFLLSNLKKEDSICWGDRIFLISLLLLLITPIFAKRIKNVKRWLHVFGVSIQASELLKTFIVFPVSFLVSNEQNRTLIILMLLVICLCAIQPDLGMAFLIACNCFTIIFFHGKYLKQYFICLGIMFVIIAIAGIFLAKHAHNRLPIFFGKEAGFQITRALLSIGNSHILGEGQFTYIPDSHCDFIFTEICNYFGILVGIFIICIPTLIFSEARKQLKYLDYRTQMIVIGLCVQIIIQTYFHVLSNLAFVPTKGVSLPMVSVGGSNIITHGLSMGILLSILKLY